MNSIRRGLQAFLYDMRHSLPVGATIAMAFLAFVFVMLVLVGVAHASIIR